LSDSVRPRDTAGYVVGVVDGDVMVFRDEAEARSFVEEIDALADYSWFARGDGTALAPERSRDSRGWTLREVPGTDRSAEVRNQLVRAVEAWRPDRRPDDPPASSTPELLVLIAAANRPGCWSLPVAILASLLVGYAYRRSR
jgi:hypothetical protein